MRLSVEQTGAPESIVIAGPDGAPVDLTSLTVTVERRTWFFQALLVTLVGLLATATGAAALWQTRPRAHHEPESSEQTPSDAPTPKVAA